MTISGKNSFFSRTVRTLCGYCIPAIDVHAAIVRGLSSPHSQDKKDGDPNRVAPPVSMEDVYGMENVKVIFIVVFRSWLCIRI